MTAAMADRVELEGQEMRLRTPMSLWVIFEGKAEGKLTWPSVSSSEADAAARSKSGQHLDSRIAPRQNKKAAEGE